MSPEKTKKLKDKYQVLFSNKRSIGTPFYYGGHFECGDGWYDILDEAAAKIMALDKKNPPSVAQIKEKFGQLRIYLVLDHADRADKAYSKKIYRITDDAEKKSATTCETCGAPGTVQGKDWLYTSCEEHKRKK